MLNRPAGNNLADPDSPSRAALIDAALALFLKRGFARTRVEDIAMRAGVSKGAVYLHFRTKNDLFSAVVRSGVLTQLEQAEQLAAGFTGSASDLLTTMLQNNLIEFWGSESSGIAKLVIAESQQFPKLADAYHEEVTGRAHQLIGKILELGVRQGEYRAIDVPYTARCIVDALDYELVLAHALSPERRRDFDAQRFITALLELIRAGVARSDP